MNLLFTIVETPTAADDAAEPSDDAAEPAGVDETSGVEGYAGPE